MFLRINQKDKSDWYVFKNKTHLHLYEHIKNNFHKTIKDVYNINGDYKTVCKKIQIINENTKNKILNDCKTEKEYDRTKSCIYKYVSTKNPKKYKLIYKNEYIILLENIQQYLNDIKSIKKYFNNYYQLIIKRKQTNILKRALQNKVIINRNICNAFYDSNKYLTSDNYIITGNNLAFITALINSNIMNLLLEGIKVEKFPNNKKLMLKTFSILTVIPDITTEIEEFIMKQVLYIQDKKQKDINTDNEELNLNHFIYELYKIDKSYFDYIDNFNKID